MTSDHVRKFFTLFFVLGFFAYLFGPLIIMGLTAFNSAPFPRVSPWECFSVEWFNVLVNDAKLVEGLRNSFFIGLGVVFVAVPVGLAGALMLTQVRERVRPWYYTIVISPILVPGVVLGISTLLFWDRVGHMFGASTESVFYNGFFLNHYRSGDIYIGLYHAGIYPRAYNVLIQHRKRRHSIWAQLTYRHFVRYYCLS